MAKGSDEIQRLIFEVETHGAAEVEQHFKNIEKGMASALREVRGFASSSGTVESSLKKAVVIASDLETAISMSNKKYSSLFSGPQMAEQERKIRGLNRELVELAKVMGGADESLKASAAERYKIVKSTLTFEAAETAKLIDRTKQEFDSMMSTEKRSMADLVSEAGKIGGKGAGAGIFGLMMGKGDMEGMIQSALGGIGKGAQVASQQAGRRYAELAASGVGAAGSGGMQAIMATLTKLGPIIVGLTAVAGVFIGGLIALDSKMTDLNRNMLEHVSLVDIASNGYTTAYDSIEDATAALGAFRKMATYNARLKNLGLDESKMGALLGQLNESGMLLGDLRKEGVSYESALIGAQEAALALGIDGTSAAELMGQMANIARTGFQESLDALTQIVHQAKDAGVSTKRFFQVVQSVGSEMGLFNYRIAETASLFGRLSKIMDAQSAEARTKDAAQQIKGMSVEDRIGLMQFAKPGQVESMVDRAQRSSAGSIDFASMSTALEKLGRGPVSDIATFEAMLSKMNSKERSVLLSELRDVDKASAGAFEKWRMLEETDRRDSLAMQGILPDLHQSDQRTLQLQRLERIAGSDIRDANVGVMEAMGLGTQEELRAIQKDFVDLQANYFRLDAAMRNGNFEEVAKGLNLNITKEQFKGLEGEYMRLDEYSTAPVDAQKDVANYARITADLQRTTLETLQNDLVGWLQRIHESLVDAYTFLTKKFGGTEHQQKADRAQKASDKKKEIEELKGKMEQEEDDAAKAVLRAQISNLNADLKKQEDENVFIARGASFKEASIMVERGRTDIEAHRESVKKDREHQREARIRSNDHGPPSDYTSFDYTSSMSVPAAQDAQILTRGIPLLNLAPGDIVVHQDSLAETIAGGKGQFVPDLMKRAGVTQGSSSAMSNTFNIYGGDANKVRETILQALTDWERKRSMS